MMVFILGILASLNTSTFDTLSFHEIRRICYRRPKCTIGGLFSDVATVENMFQLITAVLGVQWP